MVHISAAAIVVEKPHFATVRPATYDLDDGPKLANVGEYNNIYNAREREAFWEKDLDKDIDWYYNKNQIFQEDYNRRINKLK